MLAEISLANETEKLMERDYFLDAQQALEMGLVDKVLTSREDQEKALGPLKDASKDKKDDGSGGNGSGGPPPAPSTESTSS